MQLTHIPIDQLAVSSANMRQSRKPPEIGDLLPSVRARGVLVPLLVRSNGSPDHYEIVAGRRRFFAAQALVQEGGEPTALPCAVLEAGDDAGALEASLIENHAREAPHEVELWTSFTALVRLGRTPEEIALTFGMTARQVAQVLALGSLLPKIRNLYRTEAIDPASIRLLTMASKAKQHEWLKLASDPKAFAPTGQRLKAWLFGGSSIPVSHAIFDLGTYSGEIVTDLFGDELYFASADDFWTAQNAAVAERRHTYLNAGWADAIVLEPGSYFHAWEYEKRPKRKGGKVYIALSARGEVTFHEGYLTRAPARRMANGTGETQEAKPARPEVTAALNNYVDLHRHAAVRTALLGHSGVALRLMAAHAISGSSLFSVRPDPRRPMSDAIAGSAELSQAECRFDAARRKLLALLELDADSPTLMQGYGSHDGPTGTTALFLKLLHCTDAQVLHIIALAMGEALEAGSMVVEALGLHLGVDMSKAWAPDDAFYGLLRDKEVLGRMVAEVAGEEVAAANAKEKAASLKAIIRDCVSGENGREKLYGWVPRWMAFPPRAYTARGGVGTVRASAAAMPLIEAAADDGRAPEKDPDQGGATDRPDDGSSVQGTNQLAA